MNGSKQYVGFGYKARHGKDTAAHAIHYAFPRDTCILGFADALKSYARVAFGMRKKDGALLQTLGTDLFRRTNRNIWVEVLEAAAKEVPEPIILIPDVRFPNEAEFVKGHGGPLIQVTRLDSDGLPWVAPDRPATHESETALDDYKLWDHTLVARDGDIHTLEAMAVGAFRKWLKSRNVAR